MKVRILCLAEYAYAMITDEGAGSLDVRLEPGRSPARSLRETAEEMRVKAYVAIRRAEKMERAAEILEPTGAQVTA